MGFRMSMASIFWSVSEAGVCITVDPLCVSIVIRSERGGLVDPHRLEQAILKDALLVLVDVNRGTGRADRVHPGTAPVLVVVHSLDELTILRLALRVLVEVAHF